MLLEAAMEKAMRMTAQQEQMRAAAFQHGREESHARMLLELATGNGDMGDSYQRFSSTAMVPTASPSFSAAPLSHPGRLMPSMQLQSGMGTDQRFSMNHRNSHNSLTAAMLSSGHPVGMSTTPAAFMDALSSTGRSHYY